MNLILNLIMNDPEIKEMVEQHWIKQFDRYEASLEGETRERFKNYTSHLRGRMVETYALLPTEDQMDYYTACLQAMVKFNPEMAKLVLTTNHQKAITSLLPSSSSTF